VSALGCPRVFSEHHNTVTDQNERLGFVWPRKDLWETADGTIDYLNLIYDASFGGTEVLAKVVLIRMAPISRPSTWHLSYMELPT
jgi:hypothetical protein